MSGFPCRQMIKVLTDEQVESIHEASLKILRVTGVRFDGADARNRLLKAGAEAHPSKKDVLLFPADVIEESVRKVPRQFTYHARERKFDISYDGEHCFPYAGGGDPKIIDLETGAVRPSLYSDVEDAAKLGDALQNNHFASHLVVPNDVPAGMIELRTMEAGMKNSSKPLSHHATSTAAVDYMFKMWTCVAGGEEELRKRPLFSLASSPSSPLTYTKHVCEVLVRSCELGMPFSVIPCPIAGETGPMSLGGSLALQNAESLAGLVLIQSIAPKLPSVYCGRVCFMDPRTGRDLWGVPEEALASAAMVQLANRYNMVADSCGTVSDITRWDIQLGFEQMMTGIMPVLAGAESVSGIGCGWEGASSLESMVIDNEVFEDIARIMRTIAVDDDRLGLDVIDKVGHMGSYLAQPHTMARLREGEFRLSSLWDKRISEKAKRQGFKTLQERAGDEAKKILKEHVPTPLDKDTARDVDAVLREAQRRLA